MMRNELCSPEVKISAAAVGAGIMLAAFTRSLKPDRVYSHLAQVFEGVCVYPELRGKFMPALDGLAYYDGSTHGTSPAVRVGAVSVTASTETGIFRFTLEHPRRHADRQAAGPGSITTTLTKLDLLGPAAYSTTFCTGDGQSEEIPTTLSAKRRLLSKAVNLAASNKQRSTV